MTAPPRVLSLPGGEPMLHYGAGDGPQIIVLQPLFEEMNRCRLVVATLSRALAARGFGCWLPDLPGCGDSARALESVGWNDWLKAVLDSSRLVATDTGQAPFGTIAIRGGALLDRGGTRRWRFSPVTGASLMTDLRRSGLLARGAYPLAGPLAEAVGRAEADTAAETRTVRLDGDERPCDLRVAGPAVWRRPEPLAAPELAALLADDIAAWATA